MSRTSLRSVAVEALADVLGVPAETISDDARLAQDLGVDSMKIADVIVAIERRAGARLAAAQVADLADAQTVGELVARLSDVLPK